ncbi:MAG: hypothetical protein QW491_07895 [Thermoproteota archaeon]|nr:hypothetical protein [Candidatus Brockarchaeota archaeon]
MIKEAFLSVTPMSIITLYLDNYIVYQVANGISKFSHIPPADYYSGSALSVAKQPISPIYAVIFSDVIGIPLNSILRHIGCIISGLVLPLVAYLPYKILNIHFDAKVSKFSWLSLLFSPWLIFFLIWGHYSIYSIIYFAIMLYSIMEFVLANRNMYSHLIFWIILAFGIAFAHAYMAVLAFVVYSLIFIVFMVSSFSVKKHARALLNRFFSFFATYAIIFLIYLLWYSFFYIRSIEHILRAFVETLEAGNPSVGLAYNFAPSKINVPFYVRILRWSGAVSWIFLSAVSFIFLLQKYRSSKITLIYAIFICIGFVGSITALPYIFDQKFGVDLFSRSVYFFGLMSASPFIGLASKYFSGKLKQIFFLIMLFLIVNFGIIMSPEDFQSWHYPIKSGEDVRLYPSEWVAAGLFSLNYGKSLSAACGLRQGVSKVGYFARLNYYEIQPSVSNREHFISPDKWDELKDYWTDYCFLRKSITIYEEVPGYIVNKDIFKRLVNNVNIMYTCTDVFMIYYPN